MALTTQAARRKDVRTSLTDMQHRHFATIAAIIRESVADDMQAEIARVFSNRLHETNPKFDADRFIAACFNEVSK